MRALTHQGTGKGWESWELTLISLGRWPVAAQSACRWGWGPAVGSPLLGKGLAAGTPGPEC